MSVSPAQVKLSIWKGTTFTHRFTLLTAGQGSPAKDLTGYSGQWIIKDKPEGTILFTYASPVNITFGGLAGTIDLLVDSTTTAGYTWTTGIYELLIISPAPQTDPLVFGPIVVRDI